MRRYATPRYRFYFSLSPDYAAVTRLPAADAEQRAMIAAAQGACVCAMPYCLRFFFRCVMPGVARGAFATPLMIFAIF